MGCQTVASRNRDQASLPCPAKVTQPDSLSLREVKTCINSLPFQVSFEYFTNGIQNICIHFNKTEKIAPEN